MYRYSAGYMPSNNGDHYMRHTEEPNSCYSGTEDLHRSYEFDTSRQMFYEPENNEYEISMTGSDKLTKFLNKHNIVMDDGAVVMNTNDKIAYSENQYITKKSFIPPCGCSLWQFALFILITSLLVLGAVIAAALGATYRLSGKPAFIQAQPWWRRSLIYQIHVPTFANDVKGSTGRLKDVTPRLDYLAKTVYASSAILTGILDSDSGGVRSWETIIPSINPEGEDPQELLRLLKVKAADTSISLLLGIPLYSTSRSHPWFQLSETASTLEHIDIYLWRKEPPSSIIDARYYAYSANRKEYYRHVHGNPNSPLLNFTSLFVRKQLEKVITYWKAALDLRGIFITNSSNILQEMVPHLKSFLDAQTNANDDNFVWFTDNMKIDSSLGSARLCYFEIVLKERVFTRTDDILPQIKEALNDPRLVNCSPVWRIIQESEDFTDYFTLHSLVSFLPGSHLVMAGEEVELLSGSAELITWAYGERFDFTTYQPISQLHKGVQRWSVYHAALKVAGIFDTTSGDNRVTLLENLKFSNLLVVYRTYLPLDYTATFLVSFETLNVLINLRSIVPNRNGYRQLVYCNKRDMTDHFKLSTEYLKNNEFFVFL